LKWRYAVGELFIVVIGILIAFSLDSWWEGRELAELEHRYLVSLEQDFEENQAGLHRTIRIQTDVQESIRQLILSGATSAPTPGADSIMALVSRVFRDTNVLFQPSKRTYQELLNTSNLQVLRNDSLLTLLADFDIRLGSVGRVESGGVDGWRMDVTEHLVTRLDLGALVPESMLGTGSAFEVLPSTVDYRSLPRDRVFRNIMVGRQAVTAVKLSMYRGLEGSVDEILRILDLELWR
jgi:hypothetical protein